MFPYISSFASFVISLIAITLTLRDRRPRLLLRARKGNWYVLKRTQAGGKIIFNGVIEMYNASNRANAVRDYYFAGKRNGKWEALESELYQNVEKENGKQVAVEMFNQTPLTIPPYSGVEIRVQAFLKGPQPYEMEIKIEVEDLFGKRYATEVKAIS